MSKGRWLTRPRLESSLVRALRLRILLLAGVVGVACAPVYTPPLAYAPLLGRRGDVSLAGQFGTTGTDAKAAYAFTDHFGILAGGSYNSRDRSSFDKDRTTYVDHSHVYGELGLGAFDELRVSKMGVPNGWRFVYEGFAGVGYGHSAGQIESQEQTQTIFVSGFDNPLYLTSVTGNYLSPFLQGDVGWISKHAEYALVARFVALDYFLHSVNGYPSRETRVSLFAVPAFIMRFGPELVKLEMQLGGITEFIDSSRRYAPSTPGAFASIGVFARFGGP